MPNWELIAALFRVPLRMQVLELTRALERVERALQPRLVTAERLERGTRGFPVIGFWNEAVMLELEESQRGALLEGPSGVGDTLLQAGGRFVRGLGRLPEAVREEWLLPGFVWRLVGVADAIAASLDRAIPARPSMFDAASRRASDLFGQLGLLFRALQDTGALRQLAGDLADARTLISSALAPSGPPGRRSGSGAAAAPPAREVPLDETLEQAGRFIVAAILGLPIAIQWASVVLRAVDLQVRGFLVETFRGIETRVFDLRRDVFDLFAHELPLLLVEAMQFLVAAWIVVEQHFRFYVRVGLEYGLELVATLHVFTTGLQLWLNYWITVINRVIDAIEAVLDFDLAPFIAALLLGPLGAVGGALGALPRFTVRDFVGLGANVAREALRLALVTAIGSVEASLAVGEGASRVFTWVGGPLGWWLGPRASRGLEAARFRVRAARRTVWALLRAPRALPGETEVGFALPAFPDLEAAFFGPGAPDLRPALETARTGLLQAVDSTLGAGVSFLLEESKTFDRASRAAAAYDPTATWAGIGARSDAAVDAALGDQLRDLRARRPGRGRDPIADAFEDWLTQSSNGGFYLLESVLPAYVAEMDAYWRRESAAGREPTFDLTATSPHILVRRAALGRVRVPELTVRAHGQAARTELAEQVARRFRSAVQQAYVAGEERLALRQRLAKRAEHAETGALAPTE